MNWTTQSKNIYRWHRWFAWYPVRVGKTATKTYYSVTPDNVILPKATYFINSWVWLQTVERKREGTWDSDWWEYRELGGQEEQ